MLEWIKGRRLARHEESEADAANAASAHTEPSVVCGRSGPLHKYLDGRYADAVVLTFGEIEDLIGFPLPELARQSYDWWTTPDPDTARSPLRGFVATGQEDRSANLRALTVAFDRAF